MLVITIKKELWLLVANLVISLGMLLIQVAWILSYYFYFSPCVCVWVGEFINKLLNCSVIKVLTFPQILKDCNRRSTLKLKYCDTHTHTA